FESSSRVPPSMITGAVRSGLDAPPADVPTASTRPPATSIALPAARAFAPPPPAVLSSTSCPDPCLTRTTAADPVSWPGATSDGPVNVTVPGPATVVLVNVTFFPGSPATVRLLPAAAVRGPRPTVANAPPDSWRVEGPVTPTALVRAGSEVNRLAVGT